MKLGRNIVGALHWYASGAIVIILVVVAIIVINIANDAESDASPRDRNICFTKCVWLQEHECGSNRRLGWCFPTWGCGDGIGAHTCGE